MKPEWNTRQPGFSYPSHGEQGEFLSVNLQNIVNATCPIIFYNGKRPFHPQGLAEEKGQVVSKARVYHPSRA